MLSQTSHSRGRPGTSPLVRTTRMERTFGQRRNSLIGFQGIVSVDPKTHEDDTGSGGLPRLGKHAGECEEPTALTREKVRGLGATVYQENSPFVQRGHYGAQRGTTGEPGSRMEKAVFLLTDGPALSPSGVGGLRPSVKSGKRKWYGAAACKEHVSRKKNGALYRKKSIWRVQMIRPGRG